MPSCTVPIFKCGDESPRCGGNVEAIVRECTSNLFTCVPNEEGDDDDFRMIYDLDGPDLTPKTSLWPGWTFFEDVCTTLKLDLPDCTGMAYQCDDQPAVCGTINKAKAETLKNCYRLQMCAPLEAKETQKTQMAIHLVESTVDSLEEEQAKLTDRLNAILGFSSSAKATTTTNYILLLASSAFLAAAVL